MIPCQELKAKRLKRVKKLLRKKCISKQSTKSYEYKIAKSSSPSVSWKINTSLTQKDTMDRGAWIKFQKERHEEDSKDKSPKKHKKVQNGMGMRNKWIFLFTRCTILWCPSWKLPEDKGKKWNSYSWPQKSYLDFEILVSIFLNWTIIND